MVLEILELGEGKGIEVEVANRQVTVLDMKLEEMSILEREFWTFSSLVCVCVFFFSPKECLNILVGPE